MRRAARSAVLYTPREEAAEEAKALRSRHGQQFSSYEAEIGKLSDFRNLPDDIKPIVLVRAWKNWLAKERTTGALMAAREILKGELSAPVKQSLERIKEEIGADAIQ
jgi:hypothetical protein